MVPRPTQINLSRALKLKNRLVHRLAQLDHLIVGYNSTPDENQEYDVRSLYERRAALVKHLIDLKLTISVTNQPIQRLIFELAECKGLVATLLTVPTKHGPNFEGYPPVRRTYVAQFRKAEIDRETKRVEQRIDEIQDELDRFNASTVITIDAAMMDDPDLDTVPDYEL